MFAILTNPSASLLEGQVITSTKWKVYKAIKHRITSCKSVSHQSSLIGLLAITAPQTDRYKINLFGSTIDYYQTNGIIILNTYYAPLPLLCRRLNKYVIHRI